MDKNTPHRSQRSGKTVLIIVVALVVLLAGAAVGLRFFAPGLIPGWGEPSTGTGGGQAAEKILLPMKSFIVNLQDPGGKRYLKLTLALELPSKAVQQEIEGKLPQITDAVLVLLSSKSYDDIGTMEGKEQLKAELLGRINTFLTQGQISGVFFSEFVVQ